MFVLCLNELFSRSKSYGSFCNVLAVECVNFLCLEKYHSHGGNLKVSQPPYKGMAEIFVKAGQEFGIPRTDLNAEFQEGISPIYYTQNEGRRYGTYKAFIEPARQRKNLFIYKFSHVDKVLFADSDENKAIGVQYLRHGRQKRAYASKEVILSAGSLSSPQILMLSGIGPKKHLEDFKIPVRVDLPVGKNLQDHVSSLIGPFIVDAPISMRTERDLLTAEALDTYIKTGGGPMSSTGFQAAAFLISEVAKKNGHGNWPDIEYHLVGTGVTPNQDAELTRAFNIRPGALEQYFEEAKGKDSFNIITILSRPRARGQVTLQSRDPLQPLLVDPNYFDDEDDIKVIVEGTKRAVELVENSTTFQAIGARLQSTPYAACKMYPLKSDAYWECVHRHLSLTSYHPVGTCSMGRSDSKNAVVDSELRVIGTKNLRVADASVMPTITTGNTHATTVMIGEKGADFILRHWTKF